MAHYVPEEIPKILDRLIDNMQIDISLFGLWLFVSNEHHTSEDSHSCDKSNG